MFSLRFKIAEEGRSLEALTAEEFEAEHHNLYGGLELRFQNDAPAEPVIGTVLSLDEFREEMLVTWFDNLLDAVALLPGVSRLYLSLLETPHQFLEFEPCGKDLHVRMLRFQPPKVQEKESYSQPFLSRDVHEYTVHGKEKGSSRKERAEVARVEWGPVLVRVSEFRDGVMRAVREFLGEVRNKYPGVWNSRTIQALANKMTDVEAGEAGSR